MEYMKKIQELNKLSGEQIYDTREIANRKGDREVAQDDYATRRVPSSWRWSAWGSLGAFSGVSTCMAYPITCAVLAVTYGATAMIIGIILTWIYTMLGSYFMAKKAAVEGSLNELISRQSFGFTGSAYQIFVYGLSGILLFALEGHVMSSALSEAVPILPYEVSAAVVCIVFIPLTLYGMVFLERFQSLTVWIYVVGIILAFVGLFGGWAEQASSALAGSNWWNVNPNNVPLDWVSVLGAFSGYVGILGAILVLLCTDTARFVRYKEAKKGAILHALIGVTVPTLLTALFGVYLLAATGGKQPDPGVTFVWILGPIGLLLVLLTQIRINVINVYYGTTAFENFTSQILKKNWKRTKFLIPFLAIAYLILVSPFLHYLATITTMYGLFLVNYVSALFGDFFLVRKKYNIPQWSEIRRGYLPQYNKIGLYSIWLPTIVGMVMASGAFGLKVQVLALPLTGIIAFFLPLIIASFMSKESVLKQYFSRIPHSSIPEAGSVSEHKCTICNHTFHKSDFVHCPFHGGAYICSNCCATEKQCGTVCQTESSLVFEQSAI